MSNYPCILQTNEFTIPDVFNLELFRADVEMNLHDNYIQMANLKIKDKFGVEVEHKNWEVLHGSDFNEWQKQIIIPFARGKQSMSWRFMFDIPSDTDFEFETVNFQVIPRANRTKYIAKRGG